MPKKRSRNRPNLVKSRNKKVKSFVSSSKMHNCRTSCSNRAIRSCKRTLSGCRAFATDCRSWPKISGFLKLHRKRKSPICMLITNISYRLWIKASKTKYTPMKSRQIQISSKSKLYKNNLTRSKSFWRARCKNATNYRRK